MDCALEFSSLSLRNHEKAGVLSPNNFVVTASLWEVQDRDGLVSVRLGEQTRAHLSLMLLRTLMCQGLNMSQFFFLEMSHFPGTINMH